MVFCFCVVRYVALCGLQACTMTLYLCVVKWLVLYWEHEEGDNKIVLTPDATLRAVCRGADCLLERSQRTMITARAS